MDCSRTVSQIEFGQSYVLIVLFTVRYGLKAKPASSIKEAGFVYSRAIDNRPYGVPTSSAVILSLRDSGIHASRQWYYASHSGIAASGGR